MNHPQVAQLVQQLNLQPHPEGGFFRETYRSVGSIDVPCLDGPYQSARNYATCIYFLLTSENFSAFHRIHQDEVWHFYEGAPLLLHVITPSGVYSKHLIGSPLLDEATPQFVVPGGSWFAVEVRDSNQYTLLGCTVSPGFSFEDFELAQRSTLSKQFPKHSTLIERLTRS